MLANRQAEGNHRCLVTFFFGEFLGEIFTPVSSDMILVMVPIQDIAHAELEKGTSLGQVKTMCAT